MSRSTSSFFLPCRAQNADGLSNQNWDWCRCMHWDGGRKSTRNPSAPCLHALLKRPTCTFRQHDERYRHLHITNTSSVRTSFSHVQPLMLSIHSSSALLSCTPLLQFIDDACRHKNHNIVLGTVRRDRHTGQQRVPPRRSCYLAASAETARRVSVTI